MKRRFKGCGRINFAIPRAFKLLALLAPALRYFTHVRSVFLIYDTKLTHPNSHIQLPETVFASRFIHGALWSTRIFRSRYCWTYPGWHLAFVGFRMEQSSPHSPSPKGIATVGTLFLMYFPIFISQTLSLGTIRSCLWSIPGNV
jgi:hypothetical protein